MRKYSILFFTFLVNVLVSQEISLDLPVLSPQTPNAFEFTKYGEIQVNESTGAISPSIPLFNFNAGPIDIPITLQYSGNGVKVNQEPTWAGMNWNINPGGIVTRQVRDLADEKTLVENKYYMTESNLDALSGKGTYYGTEWSEEILDIATNQNIDSEADIFNYNFLGYSGSFYLDSIISNDAHLFNHNKEVKIKFDYFANDQSRITITTPNGDRFFFGYLKSDTSKSYTNSGPGSNALAESAQNAFHLYEIKPITGGTVYFDYTDMISGTYNYTNGEQESYYVTSYVTDNGCGGGSVTIPTVGTKSTRLLITSYSSAHYLTKIWSSFDSNTVEFNSSKIGDASVNSHHRRKLNSIDLRDGNNTTINKCDLNYEIVDTENEDYENRFFLTSVQLLGKNGINDPKEYFMTYNNLQDLPEKDSYSQDHFGYFNNAHNITLLPRVDGYALIQDDPGLADREANADYALTGVLTKIQYPTGGDSEFEYELRKTGDELEQIHDQMHVYYNEPLYNETLYTDYPYNDAPFVTSSQTDVVFNVTAISTGSLLQSNFIEVIAEHSITHVQTIQSISLVNPNNTTIPHDENVTLSLGAGSYYFSMNLNLNSPGSANIEAYANFSIPGTALIPIYGSGIRIKRIKSKENESTVPMITRYYYNQKEQYQQESTASLIRQPQYIYENLNRTACGGGFYTERGIINLTTSSLNNIFSSDAGKILYPYVTVSYGGDNFENGGKELQFKAQPDNTIINYMDPSPGRTVFAGYGSNLSYANSRLIKETIFTKIGSLFNLVQETHNHYATDYSESFTLFNIKPSEYCNNVGYISSSGIERFNIGLYDTFSYWDYLDYTEVKDYRDNQLNPLTITTSYEYTSKLAGLPSEIEVDNSEGTINLKTIYYSSDGDLATLGFSTTQNDLINGMETNHQLDEVIRIETYKKDVSQPTPLSLLSITQKEYDSWSNNILAKNIQFSKNGVDFENRLTYHRYNNDGKPIEVSKTEGGHLVYIWGYNESVPIAKVENATYAEVYSHLLTLQQLSDLDVDTTTEQALRNALDNLRNDATFKDKWQVTSYTYDPLIGVTSITDPTGYTSYYVYDDFNRLQYIKDKDENVLEKYKYNYALEELIVSGNASSTALMVGDQLTLNTSASGGSGNYSYEWIIPGENNLPNSNVITITTTAMHSPSFNAICEVTDTQTLESVTYSEQITVSQNNPTLSVDPVVTIPAGSLRKSVGQNVTYGVTVTNGSGNYQYEWSKTNGQNTSVIGSGSNTVSNTVTLSDCGGFTISCKVTDTNSSEIVTNTISMIVVCGVPK